MATESTEEHGKIIKPAIKQSASFADKCCIYAIPVNMCRLFNRRVNNIKNSSYARCITCPWRDWIILELEQLSYVVRGCVNEVYRQLGCGYLEKVYERALLRELSLQGLNAERQVPFKISYKNEIIGEYYADIVVEKSVILELKAQQSMPRESEAQLLNYLKASGLSLGFLVNFIFPRAQIKRIVL